MAPHCAKALAFLAAIAAALVPATSYAQDEEEEPSAGQLAGLVFSDVTQGALRIADGKGGVVECPLRHTHVRVSISGMIAKTRVTQTFVNPFDKIIEAVYVFPLSHTAAVDEMTMVIGGRRIVGVLKLKEEARKDYEKAIEEGKTAALLEQDRPNIFTQAVGNIPVGGEVQIEISCVDVLKYDKGEYEYHFPMVVGPRYTPLASGPEAAPAQPRILAPGSRNGHDISLSLNLDAGVPIRDVKSVAHETSVKWSGDRAVEVAISPADSIPNKDFVFRYRVQGPDPVSAVLAHRAPGGDGAFMLMMVPGAKAQVNSAAPPRDVCFLVDVSGSMSGRPIAKVIEAMKLFIERMRPADRFQVVTFAGNAQQLFGEYAAASPENLEKAREFILKMRAGGGTQMLEGVTKALEAPDVERVRVVVMLTDGYIGNEAEIVGLAGTNCGPHLKFWVVGIGSSPNRFLVDGVAEATGGMGLAIGDGEVPLPVVEKILDRLTKAQIRNIDLAFEGIDGFEVFPKFVPELFADSPVIVTGRYRGAPAGAVKVTGVSEAGEKVDFELKLDGSAAAHPALPVLWARSKIKFLQYDLFKLKHMGETGPESAYERAVKAIKDLSLEYKILCEYTAFVAVEEQVIVNPDGKPEKKVVPVPIPEGSEFGGFFGAGAEGGSKYWNSAIGIGGGAGGVFGGRFGGKRNLRAYGGGRHTESAVLMSLIWLKNHQSPDGSWSSGMFMASCQKEPKCDGKGTAPDLEQSALSLLSFLGAGHTHKHGKFKEAVKNALKLLKDAQRADGAFAAEGAAVDMRTQAICAMAWAEGYGLTSQSPLLHGTAQKAVDFLIAACSPGSGWARTKGARVDSVTTAWAVLALKSAKIAGLLVPKEAFDGALKWFDSVTDESDYRVGFQDKSDRGSEGEGSKANPLTSTAAATICRIFILGTSAAKRPEILGGGLLLKQSPPAWDAKIGDMDYECWYFGTLAMFQLGGTFWKAWNEPLKNALVPTQRREGCENGSWDPLGPRGPVLGRVGASAMNSLTLEIYYRYGRILNVK